MEVNFTIHPPQSFHWFTKGQFGEFFSRAYFIQFKASFIQTVFLLHCLNVVFFQ